MILLSKVVVVVKGEKNESQPCKTSICRLARGAPSAHGPANVSTLSAFHSFALRMLKCFTYFDTIEIWLKHAAVRIFE